MTKVTTTMELGNTTVSQIKLDKVSSDSYT